MAHQQANGLIDEPLDSSDYVGTGVWNGRRGRTRTCDPQLRRLRRPRRFLCPRCVLSPARRAFEWTEGHLGRAGRRPLRITPGPLVCWWTSTSRKASNGKAIRQEVFRWYTQATGEAPRSNRMRFTTTAVRRHCRPALAWLRPYLPALCFPLLKCVRRTARGHRSRAQA